MHYELVLGHSMVNASLFQHILTTLDLSETMQDKKEREKDKLISFHYTWKYSQ